MKRMGRKKAMGLIGYICIGLLQLSCVNKEVKPNFIIFLVDDLGWMDTGYMGNKYYETLNIDQMAQEGMMFTNAYANAPNCAPSRASILSGMYPPRHGVFTVGDPARGESKNRRLIPSANKTQLGGNFVTIAEALRENGYVNAHIGKWHLGDDEKTSPEAQGFDRNIGGYYSGYPKSYFSPYKNPTLKDGPKGEYLTDRLTDEALEFVEENKDNPFFLYFSHYAVHTPIQAKQDLIAKYSDKRGDQGWDNSEYAAMVESMDESLGRLLKKLKELDLDENTMVIFFSDNGGHGGVTAHDPLRGSKGMMYEGGFREPMIAWWPGRIEPSTNSHEVVLGFDFYPTFIELAGGDTEKYHLDGESLTPILFEPGRLQREAVYWHFPAYLQSFDGIKNPADLVRGWRAVPSGAIRKGDWKLIEDFEDGHFELYNLNDDLSESNNLAYERSEKKDELLKDLKYWRKEIKASIPVQQNPNYEKRTLTKE